MASSEAVEQLTLFPPDTHASLFPTPGSDEARKMTATSGRKFAESLTRSDPVGLLVKMLLDTSLWASTTCLLTWGGRVTPRKRFLYQLRPSAPATDETGFSLWATPNTMDHMGQRSDEALIRQATTSRKGRMKPANLREQVDERTMRLWPTPRANDAEKRGNISTDQRNGLPGAVKLWPTPTANDEKNATLPPAAKERDNIPGALMREGFTAQEGQLNPEWVEILMNFPPKWTEVD